tara:strand:- start:934 stop:1191 length:258 start_codon:yes stop_codon:yes gene_type:complete
LPNELVFNHISKHTFVHSCIFRYSIYEADSSITKIQTHSKTIEYCNDLVDSISLVFTSQTNAKLYRDNDQIETKKAKGLYTRKGI